MDSPLILVLAVVAVVAALALWQRARKRRM
jgi:hypothetical protein